MNNNSNNTNNRTAIMGGPHHITEWPANITVYQASTIILLPIISLIAIYILLRIIWKVPMVNGSENYNKENKNKNSNNNHTYKSIPIYGTTNNDTIKLEENTPSLVEEGEVAGDYDLHWTKTFDFFFFICMLIFLIILFIITYYVQPNLLTSTHFWLMQLPKLICMIVVSCFGGLICKHFCDVDEKGYIMTCKSSTFKVNYTRKLQHFAAYLVPLIMKTEYKGPLALAWGDFFTLCGFLVLIKPIRERYRFFMLQFNSLDRPEDRPHTLKWIVAGNIVPGLLILLFFKWLLGNEGSGTLTFIIVFITGIGDGLAEPVGITWGKHKYKSHACFSKRKYTRSWEGSACVFLSGMIFPALQYADFQNFTQVLVAMIVLAPTMAYAEATAPHTLDTPVLMIGCGTILYLIVHFL